MPATRVLGSGLGALRETDSTTDDTTTTDSFQTQDDFDTTDTDTTDTTDTTSAPAPDTTTPDYVQDYIDRLVAKMDELEDLRSMHNMKVWWSEFSTNVKTMIQKLQDATGEAINTGSITRPGLPTRAQSLIDSIKDRASQTQFTGGSDGGSGGGGSDGTSSGGGGTTDDGGSTPSGGSDSSEPTRKEMTTVKETESMIAGFPVSQVKMVLTGGMLVGGAYFFLSER